MDEIIKILTSIVKSSNERKKESTFEFIIDNSPFSIKH